MERNAKLHIILELILLFFPFKQCLLQNQNYKKDIELYIALAF